MKEAKQMVWQNLKTSKEDYGRMARENVMEELGGQVCQAAGAKTPWECFELFFFFTKEMLTALIKCTKKHIWKYYEEMPISNIRKMRKKKKDYLYTIEMDEIGWQPLSVFTLFED